MKKQKEGQWEASWFAVVTKYQGASAEQIKERMAMPISMDEAWLQNFVWETGRKEIAWETWVRMAKSRDRPIGIVRRPWIGQPRNRGSIFKTPKKFLYSPKRPNSLWGPPSPFFNGYQGRFPQGSSNQRVKLTVHFHLLSRLRMSGAIPQLPRIRSWRVPFMRMNMWRFVWLRTQTNGRILWTQSWILGLHKRQGIC
jgi:hypothetical protein